MASSSLTSLEARFPRIPPTFDHFRCCMLPAIRATETARHNSKARRATIANPAHPAKARKGQAHPAADSHPANIPLPAWRAMLYLKHPLDAHFSERHHDLPEAMLCHRAAAGLHGPPLAAGKVNTEIVGG
jgi:hypothetical protein